MLAPQIRESVRYIVIGVGEATWTVWPRPDIGIRANADIRQPRHLRDACVDGVALPTGEPTTIGEDVGIAVGLIEVNDVPAKPGFVHHAGTGGPNPGADDASRLYRNLQREVLIHLGVIFSKAGVVAVPEHAIDHVLAVDAVVEFPDPVVADIGVGESTAVAGRVRRGPLDKAAGAGDWSQGAAQQLQADGTDRHMGSLQCIDGIHHAVGRGVRINPHQRTGCGYGSAEGVADERTQALVAGEEEEFVLLDGRRAAQTLVAAPAWERD